jgi:hypothetical protein
MNAIIHARLRQRLAAPKRTGYPYYLADFSAAPGLDVNCSFSDRKSHESIYNSLLLIKSPRRGV